MNPTNYQLISFKLAALPMDQSGPVLDPQPALFVSATRGAIGRGYKNTGCQRQPTRQMLVVFLDPAQVVAAENCVEVDITSVSRHVLFTLN